MPYVPGFEPAPEEYASGFEPQGSAKPRVFSEANPPTFGEASAELEAGKKAIGQKLSSTYESYTKPLASAVQPAANAVSNLVGLLPEALKFLFLKTGTPQIEQAMANPGSLTQGPQTSTGRVGAAVANPVNAVKDLPGLGATAGTLMMGPLGVLARIIGAGTGAAAGSAAQGDPGLTQLGHGATAATGGAIMEGLGGLGSLLRRSTPGAKATIADRQAGELRDVLSEANPSIGEAINAQDVSSLLGRNRTSAQMRQAATGGDIQAGASARLRGQISDINTQANEPLYPVEGATQQALEMVPSLIREQIIGRPQPGALSANIADPYRQTVNSGPQMLSLEQMQAVRSYLGSKAFALSPQAQGLDQVALQRLRGDVTDTIESQLTGAALQSWQQMNRQYGTSQVAEEFLTSPSAMQGGPNQLSLNRNSFSAFLDQNREDLIARLGRPVYNELVSRYLSGGQPGTRDLLATGPEGLASAAQGLARGSGGGSANFLTAPLRTLLPGLGDVRTGRAPYAIPPLLQGIFDLVGQRGLDESTRPKVPVR